MQLHPQKQHYQFMEEQIMYTKNDQKFTKSAASD